MYKCGPRAGRRSFFNDQYHEVHRCISSYPRIETRTCGCPWWCHLLEYWEYHIPRMATIPSWYVAELKISTWRAAYHLRRFQLQGKIQLNALIRAITQSQVPLIPPYLATTMEIMVPSLNLSPLLLELPSLPTGKFH